MTTRRCKGETKAGGPCGMTPQKGSAWCWAHDPDKAAERAAARKKGGRHRKRPSTDPPDDLSLQKPEDVLRLLETAARDALALDASANRVRAIGYIAERALKAIEVGELEERVEALEALFSGRRAA